MSELAINNIFTLWGGPYPKKMPWINRCNSKEVMFSRTPDLYLVEITLGCLFGFNTYEYCSLLPIFMRMPDIIKLVRDNIGLHFIEILFVYTGRAPKTEEERIIQAGSPFCSYNWCSILSDRQLLMALRRNISRPGRINTYAHDPKLIRLMILKNISSVENINPAMLKTSLTFKKLLTHPAIPRYRNGPINYIKLFARVPKLVIIVPPHICGENVTIAVLVKEPDNNHLVADVPPTHTMHRFYETYVEMGGDAEYVPLGLLSKETYEKLFLNNRIKIEKIPPRHITPHMAREYVCGGKHPRNLPPELQTQELYDIYLAKNALSSGILETIPSPFVNVSICQKYLMEHGIDEHTPRFVLKKGATRELLEKYIKTNGIHRINIQYIPHDLMDKELYNLYIEAYLARDKIIEWKYNGMNFYPVCVCNSPTHWARTAYVLLNTIPEEFVTVEMCWKFIKRYYLCLGHIPRKFRTYEICMRFAGICTILTNIPIEIATDDLMQSYRIFGLTEKITPGLNEKIERELPLLRPDIRMRFIDFRAAN